MYKLVSFTQVAALARGAFYSEYVLSRGPWNLAARALPLLIPICCRPGVFFFCLLFCGLHDTRRYQIDTRLEEFSTFLYKA